MSYLGEGFREALRLLWQLDAEVYGAAWLSLRVSTVATLMAAAAGVPLGVAVGTSQFRGQRVVRVLLDTAMALPTVVVGLFLYALLSRRGFLGPWGLLYTPGAMVAGQFLLATPLVAALTVAAVGGADPAVAKTARSLGAGWMRVRWSVASEARAAVLAAVVAGFGRVIAEVGVSIMLGGNIRHYTRNMTAAIALETSKGEFGFAIALGLVLLLVALVANAALHALRHGGTLWNPSSKSASS
ncbi:MAG: ABC transporter permease [Candidatus Brocadiia bacterium]